MVILQEEGTPRYGTGSGLVIQVRVCHGPIQVLSEHLTAVLVIVCHPLLSLVAAFRPDILLDKPTVLGPSLGNLWLARLPSVRIVPPISCTWGGPGAGGGLGRIICDINL